MRKWKRNNLALRIWSSTSWGFSRTILSSILMHIWIYANWEWSYTRKQWRIQLPMKMPKNFLKLPQRSSKKLPVYPFSSGEIFKWIKQENGFSLHMMLLGNQYLHKEKMDMKGHQEYVKAGMRYGEALRFKPDFYDGLIAQPHRLQQFEQAKLSRYYTIGTKLVLSKKKRRQFWCNCLYDIRTKGKFLVTKLTS